MDRQGHAAVELTWMEFPCGALGCHRRYHRIRHRHHRNRHIGLSWHSVGWTRPARIEPELKAFQRLLCCLSCVWCLHGLCTLRAEMQERFQSVAPLVARKIV